MQLSEKYTPRVVVNKNCALGEALLWHPDECCLYWSDIPAGILYRYSPSSQQTDSFSVGAPVGGFTINQDGRLLIFMADGAVKLWSERGVETVIKELPEERGNTFNDVIADPEGRVFCGVLSTDKRAGRLYRLDPDGAIHVMLEETGTANGMGFSNDLSKLYFNDSRKSTLSVFDYNRSTGAISNRKILLSTKREEEGSADGMIVDSEDCIWNARWAGYAVVRHDATGKELQKIPMPTRLNTTLCFGGEDLTDLYVITAGGNKPSENGEYAGALFKIETDVKGKLEFRSRF